MGHWGLGTAWEPGNELRWSGMGLSPGRDGVQSSPDGGMVGSGWVSHLGSLRRWEPALLTLVCSSCHFLWLILLDHVLSLFGDGTKVRHDTFQLEVTRINLGYVFFFFETLVDLLLGISFVLLFEICYLLAWYIVVLLRRGEYSCIQLYGSVCYLSKEYHNAKWCALF